jgi:hypothetical protein
MLHAYVERFDVMGERGNILGWDGEVNQALAMSGSWQVGSRLATTSTVD